MNTINDSFIKTSKVNCNFIYKRCRVATDFSKSKHFLHFSGLCKECGAKLIGWADNKPDEAMPLNVSIVIENMDITLTHTSKRPLNGEKLHDIGKELLHVLHDCASNWRRNATNAFKMY
ncbi:unnamed protein product [Macrosiphum euphorbiae]|uniref:Uncharacterized protein n=1 Tax=Macrosiphum euphorbiae TaxID=13131 RepID=A0AAV0WUJ1_9HEMI|nr:unnamed protein product [Macrosiphum euphorbiae]